MPFFRLLKGCGMEEVSSELQDPLPELSELLVDFFNIFHAWEEEAVSSLKTKLSILEVHAIEALGRRPPLKMRKLAEIMEISTPSVTAVVDKLEKKGFARRRTTPKDRRVFLIELTKKGLELFEKHTDQHKNMADRVLTCIPEDKVPIFLETLRNIVNASSESTALW
jgi:DNA-binding MarR family transcriptional regulator